MTASGQISQCNEQQKKALEALPVAPQVRWFGAQCLGWEGSATLGPAGDVPPAEPAVCAPHAQGKAALQLFSLGATGALLIPCSHPLECMAEFSSHLLTWICSCFSCNNIVEASVLEISSLPQ